MSSTSSLDFTKILVVIIINIEFLGKNLLDGISVIVEPLLDVCTKHRFGVDRHQDLYVHVQHQVNRPNPLYNWSGWSPPEISQSETVLHLGFDCIPQILVKNFKLVLIP